MSDLYSVIPSLTPSANDVMEAELLAKQILEAEFPDLDLREGTGLRDLVLRPTSFAFALLKKATDYYFAQNTVKGLNDSTDTDIVDDILSNWFLTRHQGTSAVISARLFFARAKNVTIPSTVYFSTDNSLKFFPISTQTFQGSSLSYDSYQNEWYVDVELAAESPGTDYNIGEGSLLYFSSFDPYFLHAEINYLSQVSSDAETNSEFISRASNAISTRNLINNPSVISNLQGSFNQLQRITPIGMGDPDMIRDQVKAIFDPEAPRALTLLSRSGSIVTATLSEHGFEVGQPVVISGASPIEYNGTYVITGTTQNTFTYTIVTTPGAVTILPMVQSSTSPCLIHTGGMVDVYCGDDVSSNIVQVTTDADGIATLTGAVYAISRSDITGGVDDDSIPTTTALSLTGTSLDTVGKKISVTTSSAHGLLTGNIVTVAGLIQTKTITTLSCTNLVVTATSVGHGLTTGMRITVSGVTPITYNGTFTVTVIDANTFTYILSINVLTPGSGTMVMTNPDVDGVFSIIYTGTNTFDISLPAVWSGATNNLSAVSFTHNVPYTVSNPNLQTKTLTNLTGSGTTATATLANHGYAANRYVTISGATPSYYNGTWKIRSVLSSTQFTFDISQTIFAPATGTISSQYVLPWDDTGFSTRQELKINFGPAYPNATASFQTQYFTYVDDVQTYLDLPTNHVLCGDYLARGYNLYVLDLSVVVYNGVAPTTGQVYDAANTYLKSLSPGRVLVLNDLASALNSAGISGIQTPIGVNYTYYHRDLITPKTGVVIDYLDPSDDTNIFILGQVVTNSLSV